MKLIKSFFCIAVCISSFGALAATHCTEGEVTLFSCQLKKGKTVSVCASKDLSPTTGYLQYRFGKIGKIEMSLPEKMFGMPEMALSRSADGHAEYNELLIYNGPFFYSITSFRQFTPTNSEGYPTPPSSDALMVTDSRKSMREDNIVFSDECSTLVSQVNVVAISKLTGKEVKRAGF